MTYSKFASPAKCLVVGNLIQAFRSLIYIRKSSEPITDPCGTSCEMGLVSESIPFIVTCLVSVEKIG